MNAKAYMEEVVKEMRKVSWPSRRELINNTMVTLAATLAISLFIYAADWVINQILEFIYQ
ncbi:MAG: preprotein translocase subunit SecE [Rhodothermia bacterium]|nr:preprotein translocase subunit SecE [Rhodothermia bacterium]